MPEKKKEKKSPPRNRFFALTGIALQMGATIYAGAYLGGYLDEKYAPEGKTYLIVCTLLAIVLSFYVLIKQVNRINDDSKND